MDMTITVRVVSQYGQRRVFPACPRADLFCEIAGTSTLTERTIKAIKALGYTVNVAQEEVTL